MNSMIEKVYRPDFKYVMDYFRFTPNKDLRSWTWTWKEFIEYLLYITSKHVSHALEKELRLALAQHYICTAKRFKEQQDLLRVNPERWHI